MSEVMDLLEYFILFYLLALIVLFNKTNKVVIGREVGYRSLQ